MPGPRSTPYRQHWLGGFYAKAIAVPALLFTAALATDWAYSASSWMLWSNASAWLLSVGLAGEVVALLALALLWRTGGGGGLALPILAAALAVELVNFLVHLRDGATSVVPSGLLLSLAGTVLVLAAAWLSRGAALGAQR